MPKGTIDSAARGAIQKRLLAKWPAELEAADLAVLKHPPSVVRTPTGLTLMLGALRKEEAVGFDIETTGLCPHRNRTATIQFGTADGKAWIVDVGAFMPLEDWRPGQRVEPWAAKTPPALEPLREFLEGVERPILVGHGLVFDLQFMLALGIRIRTRLFDTMLAHRILFAGQETLPALYNSLQWISGCLLRLWVSKEQQYDEQISWAEKLSNPAAVRYAAADAILPLLLRNGFRGYGGQKAAILADRPAGKPGLRQVAAIEMRCLPATVEMIYTGARLDPEEMDARLVQRQQETADALQKLMAEANQELLIATGRGLQRDLLGRSAVSFDSPAQVAELFKQLGMELEEDSVDQQVLKTMENPPPIVSTYLRWKELSTMCKQLITFREAINSATGRVHAGFKQMGTDTGRMSCVGPNLQNPSRSAGIREAVKPAEGNAFIICDYAAIEMRLMAVIANDKVMLEAIRNDEDLHRKTAANVTGKPKEEITRDERQAAKATNFSLIYAACAETLKDYAKSGYGVEMSLEEAERAHRGFFELYPDIAAFHARERKSLWQVKRFEEEEDTAGERQTYETRTLAGRRRHLAGGARTVQTASNSPTQGSSADILKLAMANMRDGLDAAGLSEWRLVLSVHDELVVEGPAHQAEKAKAVVQEVMEAAGRTLVPEVPIAAEAKIAYSWAEK